MEACKVREVKLLNTVTSLQNSIEILYFMLEFQKKSAHESVQQTIQKYVMVKHACMIGTVLHVHKFC